MKLSPHAFRRLWDVHAWVGVTGGLVLYVMFLTGGLTLFHEQLEIWEDPLAQRAWSEAPSLDTILSVSTAGHMPVPNDIWIFPPRDGRGEARVSVEEGGAWKTSWVDARAGQVLPERERLAHFVYELHFLWHDATGRLLYTVAGFLAVAFLLAVVTGVLIHLKDLARQLHQFRPDRSARVLWSDMHKVTGVMGLPFQLMYAYTGAFIVLSPLSVGAFTGPVFGGDARRASVLASGAGDERDDTLDESGLRDDSASLDALAWRARRDRPGLVVDAVRVLRHGAPNSVVEIAGATPGSPRGRATLRFRERDGAPLPGPPTEGPAARMRHWINGLHFASFGGGPLRVIFFVLALAGCATILTGNAVWLARRRPSAGNELLARLTVGVGAGTLVALAALFLASRLLPLTWSGRGQAEELVFFGTLLGCIVWALLARDHAASWWRQLALASALLWPVPLLAAHWSSFGLLGRGPRLGAVAAVDGGILAAAAVLGLGAAWLRAAARSGRG